MSLSKPNTRAELAEYSLSQLGKPVISINVAPQQIENRIEEALQFFQEYHYDGVVETYLRHQITEDDINNEFVTIPEDVLTIEKIVDSGRSNTFGGVMFDPEYQFFFQQGGTMLHGGGLVDYELFKQNISLMDMIFRGGSTPITFSRHQNRLLLDVNWQDRIAVGKWIVLKVQRLINPEEHGEIYNDRFLKRYTTALIKLQWGSNLMKFEGVQMAGGVTLNGRQIFDDAKEEITRLEEEMENMQGSSIFVG